MTSVTDAPENPLPFGRSRSRRAGGGRAIGWLRANLFSSIPSTVISLLLIFLLAKACVSLVQWGFWNAIWSVPDNQTGACRADPDVRRSFRRVEPAELVAQGIGAGVGRSTGRDRPVDVGRRLRIAF